MFYLVAPEGEASGGSFCSVFHVVCIPHVDVKRNYYVCMYVQVCMYLSIYQSKQ
jgi:hypothetical protein